MKTITYLNGYTVKMKNRRIIAVRNDEGWTFTLKTMFFGKHDLSQFQEVITRGQRHICTTRLAVSHEGFGGLITGYLHFLKSKEKTK